MDGIMSYLCMILQQNRHPQMHCRALSHMEKIMDILSIRFQKIQYRYIMESITDIFSKSE